MNFNTSENNAYLSIKHLVKNARVKITNSSLKKALWYHTDFPSMVAFSDVLSDFEVESICTRLNIDQLNKIPLPAIGHFDYNGNSYFITITSVIDEMVNYIVDNESINEHFSQFIRKWSGIVLLIESNERSGEKSFSKKQFWERLNILRIPVIFLVLIFISSFFWFKNTTFLLDYQTGILAVKLLGTLISGVLIWYSLDASNPVLMSICQLNKKMDCNSVLESAGAKLFGIISWAEIGLFYFAGGLVSLLVFSENQNILILINYLAILFVPYSIYYQFRVVRQWCLLCLAIQVLLILEFSFGLNIARSPFEIERLLENVLIFLITPSLWWLISPKFRKGYHFDPNNRELQKIIFSPSYLDNLINKSSPLPPFFQGMKEIYLGDVNAPHTLQVVANPTCKACEKHLTELAEVLESEKRFRARIILAAGTQHSVIADKVAMELMSLPEKEIAIKLVEWFRNPEYKTWQRNNDFKASDEGINQVELATRWLMMAGVQTAPKLFLGNTELPRVFGIKDIAKLCRIRELNVDLIES